MAASASLGRGRERKQEVKTWRYTGNFLVLKMFCLLVLLSWGRGGGGEDCLLCKLEKPIPHFCTSLYWSLEEGQQHFPVLRWCSLTNRQQNWVFWSHHTWQLLYQKSRLKVLYLGVINRDRGLLCHALYKHTRETIPAPEDLLSK